MIVIGVRGEERFPHHQFTEIIKHVVLCTALEEVLDDDEPPKNDSLERNISHLVLFCGL